MLLYFGRLNDEELTIEDLLASKFKKVNAEGESHFYLAIITRVVRKLKLGDI